MFNLIIYTMHNLSFSPPESNGDSFMVVSGCYVLSKNSDGTSCLVKVDDPYEGLDAESFSLSAQLEAGVPLQKVGALESGLSTLDRNNANASQFINSLSKISSES